MIKTIIQGDDVAEALARQQRWVDAHPEQRPDVDAPARLQHDEFLRTHKRAVAFEIETLKAEHAALTERVRLRMAKAALRG